MPSLKDNLRGWRDAATIDWFGQFIKAWIPFNAWMTDTYGDITDREMLDKLKSGGNVVFNRIAPMLDISKDSSLEADEFRMHVSELHVLLQACVVEGRRGKVSFDTVDVGANKQKVATRQKWGRTFTVERDKPNRGEISISFTGTKTTAAYSYVQTSHDRRDLEDEPSFRALTQEQRALLLGLHAAVAPRVVESVLAPHGSANILKCGQTDFVGDSGKLFGALVEIIYCLRNALFHGSITPTEQHNEIYEPAYHIVMRLVKCTI